MPSPHCSFTWPVSAGEADLIPAYARPEHACALEAEHVERVPVRRLGEPVTELRLPVPHRCHCGSWQPVGR